MIRSSMLNLWAWLGRSPRARLSTAGVQQRGEGPGRRPVVGSRLEEPAGRRKSGCIFAAARSGGRYVYPAEA